MAHLRYLPFAFEFSKRSASWKVTKAEICGLHEREDGSQDDEIVDVSIGNDLFPLSYQFLPEELWDAFNSDSFESVVVGATVDVLLRTAISMPSFHNTDAWVMRDEFLRLLPEADELANFLGRWGQWNGKELLSVFELQLAHQKFRSSLLEVSDAPPDEYKAVLRLSWKSTGWSISTDQCERAIKTTIAIDYSNRAHFQGCARADCGAPFEINSRRKKKYCSWYCGHIESVRRGRLKNRQ
jgi:hypothetical protein